MQPFPKAVDWWIHGFSLETFLVESTRSLALVREIGGQRLQFRGQLSDLPRD